MGRDVPERVTCWIFMSIAPDTGKLLLAAIVGGASVSNGKRTGSGVQDIYHRRRRVLSYGAAFPS
jgi:hypothetical protein